MLEKRRFHRVRFTAPSELTHNDITYKGQLENISLNGALLSFSDGVIIPQDEECILTVRLEGEDEPLRLVVKVIYSNFTMIGIKFASVDAETRERLYKLMTRLSNEPEKLTQERQLLEWERE
jgi:c-di-GMP-binding flagellar brake protein YcgR